MSPAPGALLFVGAVPHETRELESALGARARADAPWRLLEAAEALVLTGGIGPANAAGAVAWVLATHRVRRVVDVGSAGTYDPELLPVEGVCLVTADHFIELGTDTGDGAWRTGAELGLHLGEGGDPGNPVPCEAPPPPPPGRFPFPVIRGEAATVHHVAGTAADRATRRARCGALVESMEGAAVALVARRFGVPVSQVRGVANLAGGPREGWRVGPAGRNAQAVARWLVEELEGSGCVA